jgi:hypothetical protein
VTHDIVLMHFVVAAIEEKLARSGGSPLKRAGDKRVSSSFATESWSGHAQSMTEVQHDG